MSGTNKIRLALSPAVLTLVSGCAVLRMSDTYVAPYDVALRNVSRPTAVRPGGGGGAGGSVARLTAGDSSKFRYEDELIDFQVTAVSTHFQFVLRNKTSSTVRLLWDEATYIDPDRRVSKVMHQGARYADPTLTQAPSLIPPDTHLADVIYPSENALYRASPNAFGVPRTAWEHRPLFEPAAEVVRRSADAPEQIAAFTSRARAVAGKRVGLLLPLQVDGVTNEYTFWFEVTGVSVKSPEAAPMVRDSFGRRRPAPVSASR